MIKNIKEWSEVELTVFPELKNNSGELEDGPGLVKTITFQTNDSCQLRCTYCYETCKSQNYMNFDTAKKFIDYLFDNRLNKYAPINEYNTRGIIVDFIGGEPLLNIDLIEKICYYFEEKLFDNPDSIWALHHVYSICSNGIAYFDPKVQRLLNIYSGFISISITIDGCKELHDKCRVFPDGSPSYDIAIKAALDLLSKGYRSTKITLSPENIQYAYDGVVNMLNLGFSEIMINPVFEDGWELEHARIAYKEYKKIADYIVDNDLYDKCYIRLFDSNSYKNNKENNNNWCGSTSSMYALDYKGDIYPCIRYMGSSLDGKAEPYIVGNVEEGIGTKKLYSDRLNCLHTLTKSEQSVSECLECPIESGCAWCTAYNLQRFGTIRKRATFICDMHKAAALASKYLYKKVKDKENYDKIHVNYEISKDIISREEWDTLIWED